MQYNHDILEALNKMLESEMIEEMSTEDREYNAKIRKIADNIPKEKLAELMGNNIDPDKAHEILNKNTWQISKAVKKKIENFKTEDLKSEKEEEN